MEGKEISDPKRQCTPAKVRPVPEKLVYRKMPKDGSCVFHAMAAGIKFVTGGKLDLSARELRARAVGHLQKYADTCSKQYDKKGPDGSDMPEFEDYLTAFAAESAYAGAMEVEALCRIYSIRVILVPENAAFPVEAYHHIDLLLPEGADEAVKEGKDTRKLRYPQELLDVAASPTIAYKVGGLSRGSRTETSSCKRSVASAPSAAARAKGSACSRGSHNAVCSKYSSAPSCAKGTDWTRSPLREGKPASTGSSRRTACTSCTQPSARANKSSPRSKAKGADAGHAKVPRSEQGSEAEHCYAGTDWTCASATLQPCSQAC